MPRVAESAALFDYDPDSTATAIEIITHGLLHLAQIY